MTISLNRKMSGLALIGVFAAVLIAILLLLARTEDAVAAESNLRIAVIDTQEVMQAHPAFQEAMQEYQREMQQLQQQLEGADEEQRAMMQQMVQQQMQQKGAELQERAFEALQEDVREFADEENYDYVMDANVLLAGGTDVTDKMMEKIGEAAPTEQEPQMPEELPVTP